MGLLERVLHEEKKQGPASGLLKRANLIRSLSGEAPAAESKPEIADDKKKILQKEPLRLEESPEPEKGLKRLLRDVAGLKASIEYPAQLFQVIKQDLGVRKGALLLPEKEGSTAAPWVITGYDKTTEHRMRIPLSRMYDFFHGSDSPVAVIEKEDVATLAPYFSSREGALVERMILCGFFFEEKLLGVLIVSDSPYLCLTAREIGIFFAALEELSSAILFASRETRMRKTKEPNSRELSDFAEEIRKLRESGNRERSVAVAAIDAGPIIGKIKEVVTDLDEFRSFQDIASVASTILEGQPLFASSEKKRILFAVDEEEIDVELLLHQLSRAVRKFFQELENGPDLSVQRKSYPDDDSDPEALASSLLG